ncbi:MAG: polyisoprenyl-phosphate glycosyltransferase [Acidobacteriota bacterium]|jgi:dolichol-phosphate mannosyltransferase|nr:polyisoprenyl-phosphate glycosyltransferase [Acidobacteriota bacterium]
MQRKLSIVTPVFNEGPQIARFLEELTAVVRQLPYEIEIIAVNDGSTDNTPAILDELCGVYPELGVIHFSRNFGHQAALTAGLDGATGDAVIMMDSDLEHPPSLIPQLVARWEEGFDVVYGVRKRKRELSLFKRVTSRLFYKLMNTIAETPIPENAADFRLMSRAAADEMRGLRERARFLRGLSSWIGFRQIGVEYEPVVRRVGESKYTFRRMLNLGADGILSMSTVPLRVGLVVGFAISLLSLLYMVYIIVTWFVDNHTVLGWSSLIVSILFLGGLQLMVLGLIGIYVANIYAEVKRRPLYIVRSKQGRIAN